MSHPRHPERREGSPRFLQTGCLSRMGLLAALLAVGAGLAASSEAATKVQGASGKEGSAPYFLESAPRQIPQAILESLDLWEPEEARKQLNGPEGAGLDPDVAVYLDARISFLEGAYSRAGDLLAEISRRRPEKEPDAFTHFRDFNAATLAETRRFISKESEHFRFYYPPGPEEILVDDGLDALERQWKALSEAFGMGLPGKIRVEAAPSGRSFVVLSDIEQKAVETTGTIALCKYNRLIFTSPRALPRGYGWQDTLAHELTHYFVYKRTKNRAPVWLHEGIAKYLETLWRTGDVGELTPSQETLLLGALKGAKIIPLARMHPSFVYLKSAEEGAQAFAQVSTMVEFIHRSLGGGKFDVLNKIFDNLLAGQDYEEAIAKAAGGTFEEFYEKWLQYLRERRMRVVRKTHVEQVRFADSPEAADKAELDEIGSAKARDLVRVGDLLRDRGRFAGAAEEYRKAHDLLGPHPIVINKLAFAYLNSGQLDKAKEHLDFGLVNFPEYASIYKRLGEFYSLKQDWSNAADFLRRAIAINPFDGDVHAMLGAACEQLNDKDGLARVKKALQILGRSRREP